MVNCTRKKGGKYIAKGTYGCVFGPPLKCKEDAERMNNTYISKLMENTNAESEYEESKGMWSKIDPEQKFSLSSVKVCEFDKSNLKASNEFEKCNETSTRNKLLIYKNGGLDLSKLKPHPKNYKPLFKEFLNLMKGLEIAHKNNVVHCDIKTPNIVAAIKGNNIELRFIDYGLSKDVSEVKEYDELFTSNSTYYPYWPFEFGCFYDNGYIVPKSYIMDRFKHFNNSRDDSSGSYSLGKINMNPDDVYDLIKDIEFEYDTISKNNDNIQRIYKGLDVYSMGVVLANLLFEYFSVSLVSGDDGSSYYPFYYYIKDESYVRYNKLEEKTELTEKHIQFHRTVLEHIINPMIVLIGNMTHINPDERYTINQAIEDYEKLISAFDTYLDSKNVATGLEGQHILNKKPDIPYIETPSSVLRKQREKNKNNSTKKNSPKKNSPKKFFNPLRVYELRKKSKKERNV